MKISSPKRQGADQAATLAAVGERAWLRQVRQWLAPDPGEPHVAVAIGDDGAVLDLSGRTGPLVVSTDSLIEGVHFRPEWIGPHDLGAKALASNLSDLAAMGAEPLAAFLALSVPPETPLSRLKAFFMGIREEARTHGCPILGGDLTHAPQWVINVTVLGTAPGRVALRAAARPGQLLYVTGWPGESGAGLTALQKGVAAPALVRRHCRPTPRLKEAAVLVRLCPDLAMIDVSDGIWNDADQIAEASGVRIELEAGALPTSAAMERLARQIKADPCDWTLFGGEDYELLFTTGASLERIQEALGKAGLGTSVHLIGRVARGCGVHLMDPDGRELAIADKTFRHF